MTAPAFARSCLLLAFVWIASGARFDFPNFYNTINLNLQGGAIKDGGKLLVSGAGSDQTGSAWLRFPIDLTQPWSTQFSFTIDGSGADGLAFVIQGMSDGAVGLDASGIGYAGITHSIAVEFDTHMNADIGDPNDNHISIHMRPNGAANTASESASLHTEPNPTSHGQPIRLDSGASYTFQVIYVTSPFPSLSFLFNGAQIYYMDGNLANTLSLPSGLAWIGFTSATGGKSQDHHVNNWLFYQLNNTEPCMQNFVGSDCTPNAAGSDSCSSISDCQACASSPYPCAWGDSCTYMSGRGGGVVSALDCPSSSDKSWIWIVVSCICIVLATLALLYYFRRRQLRQAGTTQATTGYAHVEEAQTSNYSQM